MIGKLWSRSYIHIAMCFFLVSCVGVFLVSLTAQITRAVRAASPGQASLFLPQVYASYDPAKEVIASAINQAAPEIRSFRLEKLDPQGMLAAIEQGVSIEMPFVPISATGGLLSPPDHRLVSLTPADLLAGDFKAYLAQGGGGPLEIATPPLNYFHGQEVGNPESTAGLSLFPENGWASGYIMTPEGWSFLEPILPLLNRAGVDPTPFQAALESYDHVIYNARDVIIEPAHEVGEEDEILPLQPASAPAAQPGLQSAAGVAHREGEGIPQETLQSAQSGERIPDSTPTTTIVTISLWADYEFSAAEAGVTGGGTLSSNELFASWFRMMMTAAGVQEALHQVDPNLNVQVLNVRFEGSTAGQCLTATTRAALLSESRSCPHDELHTAELVHVFSGKIGGGLAYIRGLLGPPDCTSRFPVFICTQQTNNGEHVNHGVEGHSGSLLGQVLLATHEIGHNFGAVHGRGDSRWGFTNDILLAGDYIGGDSAGFEDVLCGHSLNGFIDFWACQNYPRGYYDPMASGWVLSGNLRQLLPPYLQSSSDTGWSNDIYLSGDFNNDQLLDVAVGHTAAGVVQWSVALHRTDSTYKLDPPVVWHSGLGVPGALFFSGDFDGDGFDDLGYTGIGPGSTLTWTVARSTGSAFSLIFPGGQWTSNIGEPGDLILADDFTGDGKTDVAVGHDSGTGSIGWRVAVSAGGKFEGSPPFPLWNDAAGQAGDQFFTGDFDGDEKSDLAIAHPVSVGQVEWWIGLSSGAIFIGPALWAGDIGAQSDRFLILDLNNDDRKDVAFGHTLSSEPNGPYAWFGYESNGTSFNTWFHNLSADVCIWSASPDCGTGIMLYGYGYGYSARIVNAYSWANTNQILALRDVLNAFPP